MEMAEDPDRKSEHEEQGEQAAAEVAEVASPDHPSCPHCGWQDTRLSHTRSAWDSILRALSFRAFRCRTCGNRFRVIRHSPKG